MVLALAMVETLGNERLKPVNIMVELQGAKSCRDAVREAAAQVQRTLRETTSERNLIALHASQRRRQNPAWTRPADLEIQQEILRRAKSLDVHLERTEKISAALGEYPGRCDWGWLRLLEKELTEIELATDPKALKRLTESIHSAIQPLPEKPGAEEPVWYSGNRVI